jgi:phosphatidate cytidylyltransferase
VVLTLCAGTGIFFGVTLAVVILAVLETLAILRPHADAVLKGVVLVGAAGIYSTMCWGTEYFPLLFTVAFLCAGLYYLFRFQDIALVVNDIAIVLFIWVYVPLLFSYIVLLHALPEGHKLVFLVLLMTMVCDSSAYFAGTRWGRHRLYPAVSPKKSIEGAVGGVCGAVLAAVMSQFTYLSEISLFQAVGLAFVIGVFAQLGDLFESLLKRCACIKDSGQMFPGHGGMLDRLDSLLFAFPIAYIYVKLVL